MAKKLSVILAVMILILSGCNNTETKTKEGAGVNTDLKYGKAPVLTGDSEVYNIKDFGAAGDGKKDDRDAVKTAIEYVSEQGGGIIYFPAGNYMIGGDLNIENNGGNTVILAGNPDRKKETFIQGSRTITGDFVTLSGNNIHFSYLTFRNMSDSGSVVNIRGNSCTFTECSFLQASTKNKSTAVVVSGSDNSISYCYFGPGTTNGYIINFTKEPGKEARNNSLTDSYLGGGLPKSVLIDSKDSGNCPEDIFISRNVFLFQAIGQVYVVAVNGLKIHNNMLDGATTAIILNPDSSNIRNADIRYNYMGSKNTDVLSMFDGRTDMAGGVVTDTANGGTVSDVIITDNYFWGYYGIRLTSEKFTDFKIVNNYFVESNGASIYIKDSINNVIENNIIYSGAAADYTVYIGKIDKNTVFRNNTIGGQCSIPDFEKYKAMNIF